MRKNRIGKIIKSGDQVYCYIDDVLYHQVTITDTRKIFTATMINIILLILPIIASAPMLLPM